MKVVTGDIVVYLLWVYYWYNTYGEHVALCIKSECLDIANLILEVDPLEITGKCKDVCMQV